MRGEQVRPHRRLPAPILTRRSPVKRRLVTVLSATSLMLLSAQAAFAATGNLGF